MSYPPAFHITLRKEALPHAAGNAKVPIMKKWLSALLAALMLLSTVSCATTDETQETDADTSAADSVLESSGGTVESEGESVPPPAVEKTDYKGAPFRMATIENVPGNWYYAEEYISSGENVHVLNNTIYEMNKMVEDYLGVTFEYENLPVTTGHEVFNEVQPTMLAGDDDYQLCILHPYYDYNNFISQGYALDFYSLEDIDLSRDYWNEEVMDRLSINGHAFIGLGDLCRYQLNMIYCNKGLIEDAGKKLPYDLVRNQAWTLDELITLTADGYVDNNGNGERDYEDSYGFAALWDANATSFMQAADIYVLTRNEENAFELSMYGDRLLNLYDKLYGWSQNESFKLWTYGEYKANGGQLIDFHNGTLLATLDTLGTQYLDASFQVGLLPLPKYDVAQESYAHPNWGNNLILPMTIRNREMVGQVLEMMAYYSRTHVQEIYYNEVLQLRVSEAPDDREMVELIYNTVVFDPGIAYCDGYESLWNLVYITCFNICDGEESIASYYKRNSAPIEKRNLLEKIFDVPEPKDN